MKDKGYRHPLYTLNLMTTAPDDTAARYALAVPAGRLCVPEPWLRRAAHYATLPVLRRVRHVLLLVEPFAAPLAGVGITAGWAASMQHWHDVLTETFQAHFLLGLDKDTADQRWDELERATEEHWRKLTLWLRLSGLYLAGVPRGLPRPQAERAAVLGHALRALEDPTLRARGDLADPDLLPLLRALLREREALLARREALAVQRGRAVDQSVVLRGALMGDLMRCGEAARLVLEPAYAVLFSFERLFPSHARKGERAGRARAPAERARPPAG